MTVADRDVSYGPCEKFEEEADIVRVVNAKISVDTVGYTGPLDEATVLGVGAGKEFELVVKKAVVIVIEVEAVL